MKRLIIAVVMVACAVLLSVCGYIDLKTNSDKMINSLKKTVDAVQNESEESVKENLKTTLDIWKNCETRFKIYINHDELDDIVFSTKELEQYMSGNREIKVDEVCLDCINRLSHIVDAETPSIGEVL